MPPPQKPILIKDLVPLCSPAGFFHIKDRTGLKLPEVLPGLEHKTLEVNSVRLHTVSTGKGKGKPLMLLVHGFPE